MINVYKMLIGNPEGKGEGLCDLVVDGKITIQSILKKMV
jgi:hypothetical protein